MEKNFNDYFGGLMFKRYEFNEHYTSYVCSVRTYDQSSIQKSVMVYVMNPDATFDEAPIHKLKWFSILTTDTFNPTRRVPLYNLLRSQKDDGVSNDRILQVIHRDYQKTIYNVTIGWPIHVTLLHSEKKKSQLQWPDKLTLHQALDTYKCIVKRTDF